LYFLTSAHNFFPPKLWADNPRSTNHIIEAKVQYSNDRFSSDPHWPVLGDP
jgi:hypothetical protein